MLDICHLSEGQMARDFQHEVYQRIHEAAAIQNDGDVIIRSIVQSNMIRKRDLSFKIYIWSQMPDQIIRSKLLKIDKETGDVEQDSDEETEQIN